MKRKKPRPRYEELRRRRIAKRRIRKLTKLVFSTYKEGLAKNDRRLIGLAIAYGNLLRRIAYAHKLKPPAIVERFTCPKCRNVLFPGATAEVKGRIRRCKLCGFEWENGGRAGIRTRGLPVANRALFRTELPAPIEFFRKDDLILIRHIKDPDGIRSR